MQLVVIRFAPSAPINLPKPAAAIKRNKGKKTKTTTNHGLKYQDEF